MLPYPCQPTWWQSLATCNLIYLSCVIHMKYSFVVSHIITKLSTETSIISTCQLKYEQLPSFIKPWFIKGLHVVIVQNSKIFKILFIYFFMYFEVAFHELYRIWFYVYDQFLWQFLQKACLLVKLPMNTPPTHTQKLSTNSL